MHYEYVYKRIIMANGNTKYKLVRSKLLVN